MCFRSKAKPTSLEFLCLHHLLRYFSQHFVALRFNQERSLLRLPGNFRVKDCKKFKISPYLFSLNLGGIKSNGRNNTVPGIL
ncbi:hypothetical protein Pint_17238 [Pistacia integerrima]|uniref:Uncharacterized protein n=1 Tax=Pistacia integerrima TaxID=434235 RepID=A0ACC0YYN6_9ROSI|nr:hypothetical protein Pint_17238 [Pistacia integerrima]